MQHRKCFGFLWTQMSGNFMNSLSHGWIVFSGPSFPFVWYDTTCFARKWRNSVWYSLSIFVEFGEMVLLLYVQYDHSSLGSRLQTILALHIPDNFNSLYWLKPSRDIWHWQQTPEMCCLSQTTSFALQHWLWSRPFEGMLQLFHILDTAF